MRRRILLTTAALLTGTVALTAFYARGRAAEPELTTAVVAAATSSQSVKATGTLEAVTTVQVGTQVSGTIQSLHADFNSQVQKGQVVARARAVAAPGAGRPGAGHRGAAAGRRRAGAGRARGRPGQAAPRAQTLSGQQLIPASDARDRAARRPRAGRRVAQVGAGAGRRRRVRSLNQDRGQPRATRSSPRRSTASSSRATSTSARRSPRACRRRRCSSIAQDLRRDAGQRQRRRGRHRPHRAGAGGDVPVDAYPGETFTGTCPQVRLAAGRRAERRQLRDGDRRAEPGAEAEAGHDGERHDRDRARRRRAARAERGAALPARRRDARGATARRRRRSRPSSVRAAGAPGASASGRRTRPVAGSGCSHGETLTPVRVETGVSDGTTTAIVGGDLQRGRAAS